MHLSGGTVRWMTVDLLRTRLAAAGDPAKKAWWERYLKGAIDFHGVPMAGIRSHLATWRIETGLDPSDLQETALALLALPVAEEKLAGILLLGEHALAEGVVDHRLLDGIEALLDNRTIGDWNSVDWLCVKVLGPFIAESGPAAADRISAWATAPSPWSRRCSLVAYVPLAAGDPPVLPDLEGRLLATAAMLAPDGERFVQTAIGWTLRELSDVAPDAVHGFLDAHRSDLSVEAVRMAAARLSDSHRRHLGITGRRTRR